MRNEILSVVSALQQRRTLTRRVMLVTVMVTPLPGIRARDLVETLATIQQGGEHARAAMATPSLSAGDLRWKFLQWFQKARAMIENSLSARDREKLLPLATGWRVAGSPSNHPRELLGLIGTEFDLLLDRVYAAQESLRMTVESLISRPGVLVVLDTSVLIQHRDKFADLLIADDIGERTAAVRMVLPMVVVDELDALKESRDNQKRWRAAHALGKLDELLDEARGVGPVLINNGRPVTDLPALPVGPVYVEVLHDPPGHTRLPIADDEIVNRAVALKDVAHATNRLRLVTFDTGMHLRARAVDLDVTKLNRNEHLLPSPS